MFRGACWIRLGGACEFCTLFCSFVDVVFSSRLCRVIAHVFGDRDFSKSIFVLCDASHASELDNCF